MQNEDETDALRHRVAELERKEYGWSTEDILYQLLKAADILLDEKSYDGDRYEEIDTARKEAQALMNILRNDREEENS